MTTYLYVSLQDDDRISRFVLDPSTGALEHCGDTTVAGMPAPMAIDPQKRFLFAGRRQPGEFGLSSFRIDPATGSLSLIGGVPLQGNPVHIATDRKGNYLLSAYYYQARAGVHAIGDDGALTGQPVEWLETGTGAHYVQTDPTNRYAFVPHIAEGTHSGMNAIFQFRFDESTGRLTPNSPDRAVPNGPDGPRHLCFHPKAQAWCIRPTSRAAASPPTIWTRNRVRCRRSRPFPPCPQAMTATIPALRYRLRPRVISFTRPTAGTTASLGSE